MKLTRRIWFLALVLLLATASSGVWLFMRVREKEKVVLSAGMRGNLDECLRDGAAMCVLSRRMEFTAWDAVHSRFRNAYSGTLPWPARGRLREALDHLSEMKEACTHMFFLRLETLRRGVGMEDEIIVWHPVGSDWKESLQRVSGVPTRVERGVAEFEARDMWRKLGTLAESHFESAVSLFREIGISVP